MQTNKVRENNAALKTDLSHMSKKSLGYNRESSSLSVIDLFPETITVSARATHHPTTLATSTPNASRSKQLRPCLFQLSKPSKDIRL